MATIPTTEPLAITAGDTLTFSRTLPDYPASAGWVLSYTLINSAAKITLTASASGSDHLVSVPYSTTAAWSPGAYAWQAVVTLGVERYTICTGSLEITAAFSAATTLDTRSTAKKMLEALQSAYMQYIDNGQGHVAEYEIAGRRMKFRNAAEIWQQIEKLKREVAAEDRAARIAAGLPARRRVLVRFG